MELLDFLLLYILQLHRHLRDQKTPHLHHLLQLRETLYFVLHTLQQHKL